VIILPDLQADDGEGHHLDRDGFIQTLADAFARAQWELFVVGGAIRDELLGSPGHDIDFATPARPTEIVRILEALPGGSVYRVGEKFGTIGLVWGEFRAEVTTYRSAEAYPTGSRKPEVKYGWTLREDLARRDFTINAMARPAAGSVVIDPFGGVADVAGRVLRSVGKPSDRFREDPLRLLRGVRFAAGLDLTIEPETRQAIQDEARSLDSISRERIADELNRMLIGPHPVNALTLLRDSGLMAAAVPDLCRLTQMPDHGPRHPLSLWDHTMRVVEAVRPELMRRWAALLHDIAKPETRSFEPGGRIRFLKHEEIGAVRARELLTGLRMPGELVEGVVLLIETHMQVHAYTADWSDGAVRRLMNRLGRHFEAALELARSDAAAHDWGRSRNEPKLEALEQRARRLRMEVPEVRSPLNGEQLMARYGLGPGRWIAAVKETLTEQVMEGQLRLDDEDQAWAEADRLMQTMELETGARRSVE